MAIPYLVALRPLYERPWPTLDDYKTYEDSCKVQDLPEPEWEERTGYVVVRFKRPSQ